MIRTFIDAGVLIYAARSQGDIAERAFQIIEDENREFASSGSFVTNIAIFRT